MESCNDSYYVVTRDFTTKTARGREIKHGEGLPE